MANYKGHSKGGPKPPMWWNRSGPQTYFIRLTPSVVLECKRVRGVDPPWCYYIKIESAGSPGGRHLIGRAPKRPASIEETQRWLDTARSFIENEKRSWALMSDACEKIATKASDIGKPPVPKGGSYQAHQMALKLDQNLEMAEDVPTEKHAYKLFCRWEVNAIIEVEASNLQEAIIRAVDSENLPDGAYQEDSFMVDEAITEGLNKEENVG